MSSKTIALLGTAAVGTTLTLAGTVLGTASAAGGQADAVTGGGQILVSSDGGAGDTIAFTAQGTQDAARGQVQYVDRTGGTGAGQTVQHGTVDCLVVDGNTATVGGAWRDGTRFDLYVVDNGEGAAAAADMIALAPGNGMCDNDQSDDTTGLARGNAQVRDNTE